MIQILGWSKFIIAALCILAGILILGIGIYGVYHFNYVLNRMHAAAMGDTLGILIVFVGLMIISGFSFATLKLGFIIFFLWLASPVSSHLISRLEVMTNENLEEDCEVKQK